MQAILHHCRLSIRLPLSADISDSEPVFSGFREGMVDARLQNIDGMPRAHLPLPRRTDARVRQAFINPE
jgi:hypothetical protein